MDKDLLNKLAALNKLSLSAEEAAAQAVEFDRALAYLQPLAACDPGDVEPMIWMEDVAPVFRADTRAKSVSREQILALAPKQADSCFAVPRVAD